MNKNSNTLIKSYLALLAGVLIIGFSAILIKMAQAPGLVTAFYRVGIASVVLFVPFLVMRKKEQTTISRKGIIYAILGGVSFGIDTGIWSIGIVESNATLPTLMANLAPAWVGIGALLFFKERQRRGFWIGILMAFSGIFIMVNKDLFTPNHMLFGIISGLVAGMFYGAYHLFTQKGRSLVGTITYLFISTVSAAMVLAVMVPLFGYSFVGYDRTTWLIFLIYGAGVHVIGWTCINFAQGYVRATVVAPTLLVQPVVTAIAAFLLLGEQLSYLQIIGGSVVFAGIYVVYFTRLKAVV